MSLELQPSLTLLSTPVVITEANLKDVVKIKWVPPANSAATTSTKIEIPKTGILERIGRGIQFALYTTGYALAQLTHLGFIMLLHRGSFEEKLTFGQTLNGARTSESLYNKLSTYVEEVGQTEDISKLIELQEKWNPEALIRELEKRDPSANIRVKEPKESTSTVHELTATILERMELSGSAKESFRQKLNKGLPAREEDLELHIRAQKRLMKGVGGSTPEPSKPQVTIESNSASATTNYA